MAINKGLFILLTLLSPAMAFASSQGAQQAFDLTDSTLGYAASIATHMWINAGYF